MGILSLASEAAMRITIILVFLTFTWGSVVSSDIDLNHLLSKANDEIQSKLMNQMKAGGKSSRMNRKKITAVSREMASRNALYHKMTTNLEKEGLSNEKASELARKAVRQSRKGGKGKGHGAGGHGGHAKPVTIVDDACLGIPLTCDSNAKFRSIDGKCNNLENHYWGAMSTSFLREIDVDEYDPKANSVFLDEDEKLNGVATGTYSRSLEETSSKKERKGGKGSKRSKGGH